MNQLLAVSNPVKTIIHPLRMALEAAIAAIVLRGISLLAASKHGQPAMAELACV